MRFLLARPQAHLGKLARAERNTSARSAGAWRVVVAQDGAAVCPSKRRAFAALDRPAEIATCGRQREPANRNVWLVTSRFSHRKQKNRPEAVLSVLQLVDFLPYSGRRDWTRTNDPHHVKVVL